MKQQNVTAAERIKSFAYLLVFSFAVWLALTSTVEIQEVGVGIVVCVVVALWLSRYYLRLGLPPLSAKRVLFLFIYLAVLGAEIAKANLDVAYRVIHPKMPINPGIVVIKTGLKSDIAKMILANSVTLTPGTFTLDVIGDNLLIHWIDVQAEEVEDATEAIGERFEKYLRVIFQ